MLYIPFKLAATRLNYSMFDALGNAESGWIDEFQIEQVRALPHWNRGSLCQVTTLMRGQTIERLTLSSYSACVNTENLVIKPGSAQIDVNFVNLKFVYTSLEQFRPPHQQLLIHIERSHVDHETSRLLCLTAGGHDPSWNVSRLAHPEQRFWQRWETANIAQLVEHWYGNPVVSGSRLVLFNFLCSLQNKIINWIFYKHISICTRLHFHLLHDLLCSTFCVDTKTTGMNSFKDRFILPTPMHGLLHRWNNYNGDFLRQGPPIWIQLA